MSKNVTYEHVNKIYAEGVEKGNQEAQEIIAKARENVEQP